MTLHVTRALGLCTVQDLGRRGHMHEAVPPGGPLVPELLGAANRGANNPDDAPAIEVLGQLVVRADVDVLVAVDGASQMVRAGDEIAVASGARRVAYLAVRGGIAAPLVLGGRGTLLCAGLGAPLRVGDALTPDDAALRAGDALVLDDAARARGSDVATSTMHDTSPTQIAGLDSSTIHVIAGPDLDAFAADALGALTSAPYRILPSSDRVGTRLAGPALPRHANYREVSRPMVIGALEVPRDGQPIVLGPEHPTTGGYPIVAVIASAELGRFFAIPLGGSVRFSASR